MPKPNRKYPIVQVGISKSDIEILTKLAEEKDIPIGTMARIAIREWLHRYGNGSRFADGGE